MGIRNSRVTMRSRRLEMALAEAAHARGRRNVEALADGIDALAGGTGGQGVAELAVRAHGMLAIEDLAGGVRTPSEGLASTIERLVTYHQLAWPVARQVMTSLADVALPASAARGLLAVVSELVAIVQSDAADGREIRLFMASEPEEGGLMFAFAAQGAGEEPVLGVDGARAFRRAARLARLMGGDLVRGFRDGMLIVGVTV